MRSKLKTFLRISLLIRKSKNRNNRIWNKMLKITNQQRFYPKEKTTSSLATMKKKSQNMTRSMKVRRPKMKGP